MFETNWEKTFARMQIDSEIYCPYCGAHQWDDDGRYPISYHGDEGDVEFDCDECEKTFVVRERVERTYEVRKAGGSEDDFDSASRYQPQLIDKGVEEHKKWRKEVGLDK